MLLLLLLLLLLHRCYDTRCRAKTTVIIQPRTSRRAARSQSCRRGLRRVGCVGVGVGCVGVGVGCVGVGVGCVGVGGGCVGVVVGCVGVGVGCVGVGVGRDQQTRARARAC